MKHKLFLETFPSWCKKKNCFVQGKIERVVRDMLGNNAVNQDVILISKENFMAYKNAGDGAWAVFSEYCTYVRENSNDTEVSVPISLYNQQKSMLELYDAEIAKVGRNLWLGEEENKMVNPIYLLRERAVENLIKLSQICNLKKKL